MPPAAAGPLLALADDTVRVRPLTEHEREVLAADRSTLATLRLFILPVAVAAAVNIPDHPALLGSLTAILVILVGLAHRKAASHARELAGEVLEIDADRRAVRVLTATARVLTADHRPRDERGPA